MYIERTRVVAFDMAAGCLGSFYDWVSLPMMRLRGLQFPYLPSLPCMVWICTFIFLVSYVKMILYSKAKKKLVVFAALSYIDNKHNKK